MHDWQSHIRSLVAPLRLSPTRESEIVEELAQHLEDRWPTPSRCGRCRFPSLIASSRGPIPVWPRSQ